MLTDAPDVKSWNESTVIHLRSPKKFAHGERVIARYRHVSSKPIQKGLMRRCFQCRLRKAERLR